MSYAGKRKGGRLMIIPMKKYSFLIHHLDYDQFLIELQNLGVLDVIDRNVEPAEETYNLIQKVKQYKKVIKFLEGKAEDKKPKPGDKTADEVLYEIIDLQNEIESSKQKINSLDKVYRTLRPWGKFSVDLINKIAERGFYLKFFMVSDKKFKDEWQEEYNLEIISRLEGQIYFVVVQREGEKISLDAEEVKAPDRPASEVLNEKKKLENRINEIKVSFEELAGAYLPALEDEKLKLENKISFDKVILNTGKEAEDSLMILEGWAPDTKVEHINTILDEKGVFYLISEPLPDEKVPVLLKNNKFSKLFEPIGKLYSLPVYNELDLTPFFAPFFMLFFGFCLGDAGYGLLFIIGATLFKSRVNPTLKPILTLLQWLGGATMLFGFISGTFFGINLIELIDNGKLDWMMGLRKFMLDPGKMFYFALVLGAIQIVFGMCIRVANIIKRKGFKYSFSTFGWILLILGTLVFYLVHNTENAGMIKTIYYVWLGLCGVLILFLNNPEKNVFTNFGSGIWDVYSIATGVMGDLLSYIRLFALGVSSAILGYVFNDLAMQMSGDIPVLSQLIFLIILLVGHGLNIFMATLGAFVHPMRLTFVEFYKNSGFSGGGKAYNPFKKN